jgi:phosphatidylinositol kinase/protein kinase (PI-3  family)
VKIKGKLSSLPLSTEGQMNLLLAEAMSLDNLACMYIGWGGFM